MTGSGPEPTGTAEFACRNGHTVAWEDMSPRDNLRELPLCQRCRYPHSSLIWDKKFTAFARAFEQPDAVPASLVKLHDDPPQETR